MEKRSSYSSGAPMEEKVGYSRMIKVGSYVRIGGTTSVQPDATVFAEGDSYQQTRYVLEKQVKLLGEAGALADDVISVKIYAVNMKDSGEICKAYSEIFKPYKPLCTIVGTSALNRSSQMVEIEMEAIIGSGK